jgi:hypothetical protein
VKAAAIFMASMAAGLPTLHRKTWPPSARVLERADSVVLFDWLMSVDLNTFAKDMGW